MTTPDKCPNCGSDKFSDTWVFWCGTKIGMDSGKVYQSNLCKERTARQNAEKERDEARKERDAAIQLLANWCDAVATDSSWDGWDSFYKEAAYQPGPLRKLIDAEMKKLNEGQHE